MAQVIQTLRSLFPFAKDQAATSSSSGSGGGVVPKSGRVQQHDWTARRVLRNYAPDWCLAIALWFFLAALNRLPGHHRPFSLHDTSIQYDFAEQETVPPSLLLFISLGVPLSFVAVVGGLVYWSRWDVHGGVLGTIISYTVTGVTTQIIKMGVGRPRPDFLSRCLPPSTPAFPLTDPIPFGLNHLEDLCGKGLEEHWGRVMDGMKSFPSGHSSLSFAGLGFLSFYLAGKLHLADKRGHRTRAWLALSPLLLSTMVAVSRTADNRHHWQDVTVGSLLGFGISYVAYRAYFPPLSHPSSHLPLAPRDLQGPITSSFLNQPDDIESGPGNERLYDDEEGEAGERVVLRLSEDERAWRDADGVGR